MRTHLTLADVEAHNRKVAIGKLPRIETAVALQAAARERDVKKKTQRLQAANGKFEIQPSTDEAKLNKTERSYLMLLRSRNEVVWIGVQNVTVKLADDCRLTPDFAVLDQSGKLSLIDVKGFQREDALIKMKVAARQFPMFHFYIVKRAGLGWCEEIVNP